MNTMEPYLSTTDLNIGYSSHQHENLLFKNLNLSLYNGQMICFMGPNGIGKSSLIRTLAGLQKPLSGKVEIHTPLKHQQSAQNISVVLTDPINSMSLTVEEVVALGRYPYLGWDVRLSETDHEIIRRSIQQVQLHPLLQKKLYELSDGQVQMVMIARALAQDTPIILLDEPTAHLDLNNRVEIMNVLRKISRTLNKAILLATHELDLALQTADLLWLSGKNQNILSGFPEDLVLDGSFDEIFEFKGYDLKTGRVEHQPFRQIKLQLVGTGPEYLWTKNALERNGFEITPKSEDISIVVMPSALPLKWIITKNNRENQVFSIESLIKFIISNDCGKRP